jgi:hypothetical protein
MFIIGGLIAIGIIALLGAFFLARGGGKANGSTPQKVDTPQENTQLAVPISASRPQISQDGQATGSQPLAQPSPFVRSNTAPGMQGQLSELAEQIQLLQVQSREIEQRLQGISAVLNRLDQLDYAESPVDAFTLTPSTTH